MRTLFDVEHITKHEGCLPNLHTFLGAPSVAESVVPGRPVDHITLIIRSPSFMWKFDDTLKAISQSTRPVRYLLAQFISFGFVQQSWMGGDELIA